METLTMPMQTGLNEVQIDLLKMFSIPMSNSDLVELRKLLRDFLSKRIDDEVDLIWEQKQMSASEMDRVLNTHIKRNN